MNDISTSTLMGQERVAGAKGVQLSIRWWLPAAPRRATLAIVPGFKSHSGHYAWAASQFAADGIATYAVDLRGRGQSDGERFFVEDVADYLSDIGTLVSLARAQAPDAPVFLLGHSAGGVLASVYALDHQDELKGLLCESFAFRVPAPPLVLAITRWISRIAPRLRVLKLPNAGFSRDPDVVKALDADTLIRNEVQPAKTVAEMLRAIERLESGFDRFRLPLLILHGSADTVTLKAGSERFYEKAGSADKTLSIYPDHVHDLLNDLGKQGVIGDMKRWIHQRL
jgi:acylglycerol lipase